MNDNERMAIIQRAKDMLCEHFEVGIILVQNHDPDTDETETWDGGWGNRLARDRHISLIYQDRIVFSSSSEEENKDEDGEDGLKSF